MTTQAATVGVTITEKAAQHVRHLMELDKFTPEQVGLRVAVKGGGCSGLSYTMGFEAALKPGDQLIEQHGIRLFVDPKSLFFLKGTELDFTDGLNGKGFVFTNPNATKTCGCGSSFAV